MTTADVEKRNVEALEGLEEHRAEHAKRDRHTTKKASEENDVG